MISEIYYMFVVIKLFRTFLHLPHRMFTPGVYCSHQWQLLGAKEGRVAPHPGAIEAAILHLTRQI